MSQLSLRSTKLKKSRYRGIRHQDGLPCNGQRTHTNAKTCRKLSRVRSQKLE